MKKKLFFLSFLVRNTQSTCKISNSVDLLSFLTLVHEALELLGQNNKTKKEKQNKIRKIIQMRRYRSQWSFVLDLIFKSKRTINETSICLLDGNEWPVRYRGHGVGGSRNTESSRWITFFRKHSLPSGRHQVGKRGEAFAYAKWRSFSGQTLWINLQTLLKVSINFESTFARTVDTNQVLHEFM